MKLTAKTILIATVISMALPTAIMAKGTKTTTSSAAQPATKPAPKPVAPRPSLYSGPDYDNVLGLGNYYVTK